MRCGSKTRRCRHAERSELRGIEQPGKGRRRRVIFLKIDFSLSPLSLSFSFPKSLFNSLRLSSQLRIAFRPAGDSLRSLEGGQWRRLHPSPAFAAFAAVAPKNLLGGKHRRRRKGRKKKVEKKTKAHFCSYFGFSSSSSVSSSSSFTTQSTTASYPTNLLNSSTTSKYT